MVKITIDKFLGEIPKLAPHLLPPGFAVFVDGARLESGDLSPMRLTQTINTFATVMDKVYLWGSTWLGWTGDVDAVPGPVATDRLYITGDGAPKMRLTSGAEYALAIAPPANPMTTALLGTLDTSAAETIHYAYTWVTSLGEESQPSPLSAALQWSPGLAVRLTGFDPTPANRMITKKRIYRSQTSATGSTDLYFVAEIAESLTTYDHDLALEPYVEPIPSTDYDLPPSSMRGITAMPNGIMAAFDGKEVLFCEPYQPHAWPNKYRLTCDFTIVGLAAIGSTLAIMTTGYPYVAQGIHPDSMAMERIEQNYPCMSKRGIVDLGYAAAYPSTDGLITISQSAGAAVATKNLFTREQWTALNPGTFRASQIDGRYIFSYGTTRSTGIIDLSGQVPFYIRHGLGPKDLVFDLLTGNTLALLDNGKDVAIFDSLAQSYGTYRWQSQEFFFPTPVSFGAILVEGDQLITGAGHTFLIEVYADGTLFSSTSAFNAIQRLPIGQFQKWQVKVNTNARVRRITLASDPSEIAGA